MSTASSVRNASRISVCLFALVAVACGGSSNTPAGTTDAGNSDTSSDAATTIPATDAASGSDSASEASSTDDGGDDSGGGGCATPLDSTYKCPKTPTAAGAKVCNDDDLTTYVAACFGSGTTATCDAWTAAHASCNTCVNAWIYSDGFINTGACYVAIDPTATDCANADSCSDDCVNNVVCSACVTDTETTACDNAATASGGACFTVANIAKLTTCQADAKFAACQINTDADVLKFFRGACRDGGDWTNAGSTLGDAGVSETGSDAAASDAAATDAAVSDAAASG
jgi:hypothetical protein